jgi:AbrB family looped-hinge helix DNA binding protein
MTARVKVSEGGRIVIPAELRQALGINVGDEVLVQLEDGEIRLMPASQAIRRVQEALAKYKPAGRSAVDDLIAERRAEAASE